MVSRKFRSAVLVMVVAAAVVLSGCVGSDPGTNTTEAPETTVSSEENATDSTETTSSPDGNTSANQSDAGGVAETFKQRMSALDSYSATMSQRMTIDGNQTNITTKIWARPATDEIRREVVSSPYTNGSVSIINESMMVTYNPDSNTVTRVNRSSFQQGQTGGASMTMIGSMANTMTVEKLGTEQLDGEQTYRVRLHPNSSIGMQNMDFTAWLDADTYFPVRIETTSSTSQMNYSSVVEYENVELNPTIPDSRFSLDAPADANTSDVSLPDSEVYDSIDAVRANTSMSVPRPDLPEGFSLEQARITRGESQSVSLQYRNESTRFSVSKSNSSVYNESDDGETVQVGDQTGEYHEFGTANMVVWSCDGNRYSVSGTLSRSQLMDIAASIECA